MNPLGADTLTLQDNWLALLRRCVLFVFGFGLLAHAYCYLNPIFSHDALYTLSAAHDNAWQIELGRWAQPIYRALRAPVTAPWLIGCISLFFLSLVSFFTIRILGLRSAALRVLACGLLTCYMTVTIVNASYLSWADMFMLALALCCAGVFLLKRFKFGFLGGALCLAVALALYQPYLSVAVGLVLLLLIKMALEKKSMRAVFTVAWKGLAMGALAWILYWIGQQISLGVTGLTLTDSYNSIAGIWNFSGHARLQLFIDTYRTFFSSFFSAGGYNVPAAVAVNVLIATVTLAALAAAAHRNRLRAAHIAVLLAALVLLPFGLNLAYFMSKAAEHDVMKYAFVLLYLLALFAADKFIFRENPESSAPKETRRGAYRIAQIAVCLLMALIIGNGVIYANGAYLKKDLEYQATLSVMTRVADRLEQTEGYVAGQTQVLFIGLPPEITRTGFARYADATGLSNNRSLTYDEIYPYYFEQVMGREINITFGLPADTADNQAAIERMPAFPGSGCCAYVDGVLVVKME